MPGPEERLQRAEGRYQAANRTYQSAVSQMQRINQMLDDDSYFTEYGQQQARSWLGVTDTTQPIAPHTVISSLNTTIDAQLDAMDRAFEEILAVGGAEYAFANFPERHSEIASHVRANTPAAPPRPTYQFQFADNGDLYRIGNDGSFEFVRNVPEFAQKNVQVVTDQRTGEAFALTTDASGNVVNRQSLGQYAHPEIDPERIFQREALFQAANIEQSFAGLELQRRGQITQALGQDFAFQMELGRMTYDEAQLRLNTVNAAHEQRRAERQAILQYGVTRESLRTLASGETVTRLPFAQQTAALLSQATGQEFRPEDFELAITAVDPEQAARDVVQAGQFTSPIPGLAAGLQQTRDAISQIFAEPLGDFTVSNQVTQMAAGG